MIQRPRHALTPDKVYSRAVSNHPLREGEEEAITWMSFDRSNGVDYRRVPYTRRPNGEPVFDDPEMFTVAVRPAEHMPGYSNWSELSPNPTTGFGFTRRAG
ncbi:hypothetical protein [Nonomuraea sp. B19D2]|uniref:hypothetical protein n=1 Tax=Nonomuraea sp. B19D2 TaxID=3159561 RepID=UPI0032DA964D